MGKRASESASEVLKRWRTAKGLSQESAAALIEVDQATLSRWEAGLRKPRLPEAIRLEDASEGGVPVRLWREVVGHRKAS